MLLFHRWGSRRAADVPAMTVRVERAWSADSPVQLCAEKKGQTELTEVDLYQSDRSQIARHVFSLAPSPALSRARARTHLPPGICMPKPKRVKGFKCH